MGIKFSPKIKCKPHLAGRPRIEYFSFFAKYYSSGVVFKAHDIVYIKARFPFSNTLLGYNVFHDCNSCRRLAAVDPSVSE
jgi:hypothetical protein